MPRSINEGVIAYLPFKNSSLKDSLTKNEKRVANDAIWGNTKSVPTFVKGFSDTQDGSDLAISFDGDSSFIKLRDNPTLQFKTQFSISLWIKPDLNRLLQQGTEANMQIFHKSAYDGYSNESYSALIRRVRLQTFALDDFYEQHPILIPTFTIRSNIKMENTSSRCDIPGRDWQTANFTVNPYIVDIVANNTWYHVVYSYNDSTAAVYLDGNLSGTSKLRGTQIQSCPGGDLRFAMGDIRYRFYFKGAMDEIRIYDRQLNDK